jgi:hypothetical protein
MVIVREAESEEPVEAASRFRTLCPNCPLLSSKSDRLLGYPQSRVPRSLRNPRSTFRIFDQSPITFHQSLCFSAVPRSAFKTIVPSARLG